MFWRIKMSNPNLPIINDGVKYVNGLSLNFASNTTVQLSVGQARDSRDENDIIVGFDNLTASNQFITLSTQFVGANGLDAGVIAISSIYAVYAIGDSTGNHVGAG